MAQANFISQAAQDFRADTVAAANFFGSQISEPGSQIELVPDERLNRALTLAQMNASLQSGTFGLTGPGQLRTLSPLNQMIARLQMNPSLDRKQKRRTLKILQKYVNGQPIRHGEDNKQLRRLFKAEGITAADFLREQKDFETRLAPILEKTRGITEEQFGNNIQAALRASQLAVQLGENPIQAANDPNSLTSQFLRQSRRDLDQQRERFSTQAALRGRFGGYNPAGQLGEIDRTFANQQEDSLLNAILASQQVGMQQLGGLQGYLGGIQNANLGAAGQTNSALASAAQIAAQQAAATNALRQATGPAQAWQSSALLTGTGPSAQSLSGFFPQQQSLSSQGQGPATGQINSMNAAALLG